MTRSQPPRGTDLPSPDATARVLHHSLALGGSKVGASLLLFLWQVALARELGATTYGLYATIGAALAVAAVVPDLGLGLVVSRDAAKKPSSAPHLLAATLVLQPAVALATTAVFVSSGWWLTRGHGLLALLVLAALPLAGDTVGNLCHAQLVAAERLGVVSVIGVLHAVVLVVVGGAVLWSGFGLAGVYVAIVVASVIRALVSWQRLSRLGVAPVWPVAPALVRRLLEQGVPVALIALVGTARLHADKLLVTPVLGVAATGQLQAAFVVTFGLGEVLSATLLTVTLPGMSRAYQDGRHDRFNYLVERLAAAGLLLGIPLTCGAALVGEQGCRWLFGAGFEQTAQLLVLLLMALGLAMVGSAFQQVLVIQERQRTLLVVRAGALAGLLVLLVWLVPTTGLVGAAVAAVASEGVALVAVAVLARPPRAMVRRLGGTAAIAGLVATGATLAARALDPAGGPVAGLVMAALYLAGIAVSGVVSAGEWRLLGTALGLRSNRGAR